MLISIREFKKGLTRRKKVVFYEAKVCDRLKETLVLRERSTWKRHNISSFTL